MSSHLPAAPVGQLEQREALQLPVQLVLCQPGVLLPGQGCSAAAVHGTELLWEGSYTQSKGYLLGPAPQNYIQGKKDESDSHVGVATVFGFMLSVFTRILKGKGCF